MRNVQGVPVSSSADGVAVFAAVAFALYAAHMVADYWLQPAVIALGKAGPGGRGRWLCAVHVLIHAAAGVAALAVLVAAVDLNVQTGAVAVGLTVNAVSHYFADRRGPLRALSRAIGSERFWLLGEPREGRDDNRCLGTGAHVQDQAWHVGWLFVAAAIIAA
jgi:hypothetical protein